MNRERQTPILVTLVTGPSAAAREAAIAAVLDGAAPAGSAILLEGLPDGAGRLDTIAAACDLQLARIAPGCLCCSGNLTMRVTLNRLLRRNPPRLYIGIATAAHLDTIHDFLGQPPYADLLSLTAPIVA